MIEIQGSVDIGGQIIIGPVPVFFETNFFVTQDGVDNLVTQTNDPFIEE